MAKKKQTKKKPAKKKLTDLDIEFSDVSTHITGIGQDILGSAKAFAALKDYLEKNKKQFICIDIWCGF